MEKKRKSFLKYFKGSQLVVAFYSEEKHHSFQRFEPPAIKANEQQYFITSLSLLMSLCMQLSKSFLMYLVLLMIAVSEGNAFSLFNLLFLLIHLASDQESTK